MIEVDFYNQVADEFLKFAVIISKTNGKWVFCKHKERDTYEVPGGHRECGESIYETATRELKEETGAIDFTIITDNLADRWTYPLIQPKLLEEAEKRGYL